MGPLMAAPLLHYLDTNVLISILDGKEPLAEPQAEFVRRLDAGEARAVTSELTLAECLVLPYARNDKKLIARYLLFMEGRSQFPVLPVSRAVLVRAAGLRAESRIHLPDAIHVATAEIADCDIFVTDDNRIKPDKPMRRSRWADFRID